MAKRKKKSKARSSITKNIVVFFILSISVIAIGYYFIKLKENTALNNDKFPIRGVDLSHHNPIIDWDKIDNHDISFIYLKATGGVSHLDRNYIYNYQSAKKSKIKVGTYHFYLFGVSGKKQAQHFIKTAKCESGDLLPAIDVEHSKDNPYSKDTAYMKIVVSELKVLEKELHEYFGLRPVIYTNKECYKLYIKDNFPENQMWICDLQKEPSEISNWAIWQYSHRGKLEGFTGEIDFNYFRYTSDEFYKILIP